MKILGISGSLRADSHNTKLLVAARALLPDGAELELLDPALLKAVPAFDEDDELRATPPGNDVLAIRELRRRIEQADAVLFATPEYNSSVPGALKNALDWISRPVATNALRGKPVAVVGASTGLFGAVWAQAELRKILGATGARVVDLELPLVQADEQWNADGGLAEQELVEQLRAHVAALVDSAAPGQQRRAA